MLPSALPSFVSEDDPPAKRAIITAALELFATKGVDGVSIRDIAAASGFSNPAMFRHFKSKEDLAKALFETCYRRLAVTMRREANAPGSNLKDVLRRSLELIESSPEGVHFVLENLRRYWRDLPREIRTISLLGSMRYLIKVEQEAGRIRRHVDVDLASALVLGALAQIARMAHFGELPKPPRTLADELFTLIDRGVGL
jgi:AcrR family transcriptional regulator